MFKLRVYTQEGSESNNKGIKKAIISEGAKKDMIKEAEAQILKAEVIRIKDNQIVFTNNK